MGVYIKDMHMPETCEMCRFGGWSNIHQTAYCKLEYYELCFSDYSTEYKTQRSEICPLVDLGKHGRLIDADALEPDADYDDGEFWAYSITQVRSAQTIVEAE